MSFNLLYDILLWRYFTRTIYCTYASLTQWYCYDFISLERYISLQICCMLHEIWLQWDFARTIHQWDIDGKRCCLIELLWQSLACMCNVSPRYCQHIGKISKKQSAIVNNYRFHHFCTILYTGQQNKTPKTNLTYWLTDWLTDQASE